MKLKNSLLEILIWLCKPFLGCPNQAEDRFLVVSTTGLGDALWATPAVRSLRKAFPKGYIASLTTSLGGQVFHQNPHLNESFVIGSPILWGVLRLFPILRRRRIGVVLLFHASQRVILPFCTLIGASKIVGTGNHYKGLDHLITDKVEVGDGLHQIHRRIRIVKHLKTEVEEETKMEVFQSEVLGGLRLKTKAIGLHPGAKDLFKRWPPIHFIEVGRRLVKMKACTIVVTGSRNERLLIEEIVTAIPNAISIWDRSVEELTSILKQLALYITNDTGTMHLALAVGTPTLGLFAPTSSACCGPYQFVRARVIQKNPTCFPCLKKRCRTPICLWQIGPDEVVEIASRMMEEWEYEIRGDMRLREI